MTPKQNRTQTRTRDFETAQSLSGVLTNKTTIWSHDEINRQGQQGANTAIVNHAEHPKVSSTRLAVPDDFDFEIIAGATFADPFTGGRLTVNEADKFGVLAPTRQAPSSLAKSSRASTLSTYSLLWFNECSASPSYRSSPSVTLQSNTL